MPSDKLPPEIREEIERHKLAFWGPMERIALASLRHAARECARLCEASVSEAWDEFMDGANARSQTCVSAINRYAAALTEETMLPEQVVQESSSQNKHTSAGASKPASGSATEREGLTERLLFDARAWEIAGEHSTAAKNTAKLERETVEALRALDSGHGVSFENWLGYQPWQPVGGGKWYGADTVLAAWNAGSTARLDSGPTSEEETKRVNEWRSAMLQVFVNESGVDWLCNLAIDGLRWAGKGARE